MACSPSEGSDVRGDAVRVSESATLVSMAPTLPMCRPLVWAELSGGNNAGASWGRTGLGCVRAGELTVDVLTLCEAAGKRQGVSVVSMGTSGAGFVAGGEEDEPDGTQRRFAALAPSCAGGSPCGKRIASLARTRFGRSCSRL